MKVQFVLFPAVKSGDHKRLMIRLKSDMRQKAGVQNAMNDFRPYDPRVGSRRSSVRFVRFIIYPCVLRNPINFPSPGSIIGKACSKRQEFCVMSDITKRT